MLIPQVEPVSKQGKSGLAAQSGTRMMNDARCHMLTELACEPCKREKYP